MKQEIRNLKYEMRWRARLLGFVLLSYFAFGHSYLAFAKGSGTTAANFLKIGASGRQAAMGEAVIGLADDANASLTNPAAWGLLGRNEASLLRTEWLNEMTYTGAVYGHSSRDYGNWGGSLLWLDIPDTQGYDVLGQKMGKVKASDKALLLGHGQAFGDVTAGANVKVVQQDLNALTARAWAMDAGVHWRLPWETVNHRFMAGAAVRNFGSKVKFIEEKGALPMSFDLGLGWRSLQGSLKAAIDISLPREGGMEARLGTEYWIAQALALRGGFKPGQDLGSGLSLGIGLCVRDIYFDYAIVNFGDLENTHRMSLRFRFGGTLGEDYAGALIDAERGDSIVAVEKLSRVLEQEPFNAEAVAQMRIIKQLSVRESLSKVDTTPYQQAKRLFAHGQYLAAMDKSLEAMISQPERADEIRQFVVSIGVEMQKQEPWMSAEEREEVRRLLAKGQMSERVRPFEQKQYQQAQRLYEQHQYLRAYQLFEDLEENGSFELNKQARKYSEEIRKTMAIRANGSATDGESYYARGFMAYTYGDYSKAISDWRQVLQQDPQNEEAALYLRLIEEKPEDVFLKTRVAFLIRSGLQDFEEGNYEVAYRAWKEARALRPDDPEIEGHLLMVRAKLFEEAKQAYRAERWSHVVEILEELQRDRALQPGSQRLLEDAIDRMRKPVAAMKMAKPTPKQQTPAEGPAVLEADRSVREPAKALEVYQEGFVSYARGDIDRAVILWEEAVRLDPGKRRYQEALQRARMDKNILVK